MSRIAAPEFEDFDWFPAMLRDPMTGWLRVMSELSGISTFAAPILLEAMQSIGSDHIIDLCSGGGGPLVSIVRRLESSHGRRVCATLTDKFPNAAAFARMEREIPGRIAGRLESTDATAVPHELVGVRTIFNAFHHLPPEIARAVLADASTKRQPIVVFEVAERGLQGVAIVLGIPLNVLLFIPLVRGITPAALALTYLLPIIPLATWWDGFASCLRAYSLPELETMVEGLQRPDYHFRIERHRVPRKPVYVTTVIGLPQ